MFFLTDRDMMKENSIIYIYILINKLYHLTNDYNISFSFFKGLQYFVKNCYFVNNAKILRIIML